MTYVRVSSAKQRSDLQRQQEHLSIHAQKQGWLVVKQYQDIASGLNDKRKGLHQLLKELPIIRPEALVISYPDRLSRFGTTIIETFCALFDTKILCTHKEK